MKVFHSPLSVILLALFLCSQCLAAKLNFLSARCRSRCFSKENQRQNITEIPVKCTTNHCLACLKPCDQRKKDALSCNWLCGLQSTLEARNCKESCKFLKHLHLQDGNYSCPTGVPNKQCLLMRPEDVQAVVVSKRKKIADLNYTISWNGSWPSSTVFVVMSRQQKKLTSLDSEWTEFKQSQTTSLSVRLAELQPLFWYQFKVVAVNEYGTSAVSLPSKYIFATPRPPGQPRDFKVTAMYITKGNVDVDVSWSKPDSAVGLPIHRYKLQWSLRLDQNQEKYMDLEVKDERLYGNIHQYRIKKLLPNRTYILEIQAITWWQGKRERSRWLRLRIRTPALTEEDDVKKKGKEYVKRPVFKVKGNAVFPKKPKVDRNISTEPTTVTVKGTMQTSAEDLNFNQTLPVSVATDGNAQIEAEKSVGDVLRISTHVISIWLCVHAALASVCYLW